MSRGLASSLYDDETSGGEARGRSQSPPTSGRSRSSSPPTRPPWGGGGGGGGRSVAFGADEDGDEDGASYGSQRTMQAKDRALRASASRAAATAKEVGRLHLQIEQHKELVEESKVVARERDDLRKQLDTTGRKLREATYTNERLRKQNTEAQAIIKTNAETVNEMDR